MAMRATKRFPEIGAVQACAGWRSPWGHIGSAAQHNGQVPEEDHQRNGDNRGILVAPLDATDKHRAEEQPLRDQTQAKDRAHGQRQGHVPPLRPQQSSNQHVLHVAADHVELAHGPVDHLHDAVDEGDAQGHQAVDGTNHYSREDILRQQGQVHG